ncbi:CHAT domain-containing protein [Thermodesulfobacteriota bacterium]
MHVTVSNDGKWMVYTSGRENFTDLWLRSADPARVVLPQRLTSDPSPESSPAFSPDGRFIAYTGTADDVKGDIYLLDIKSKESGAVRLTGRESEDGGPCFSSDGGKLYFHQADSGDGYRRLVVLDLAHADRNPVLLNTGRDGAFPAISPDGRKLAFVTYRDDPAGDIFVMDLEEQNVSPLTRGPTMDAFPEWSSDSRYVYFSRIAYDIDKDGKLTKNDNPSLYRVDVSDKKLRPYPLTLFTSPAFQPQVSGPRLFFLTDRGGVTNCWSMPVEGLIPVTDSPETQVALAEELLMKIPPNPHLSLLAYYKVLERYANARSVAAKAAFEIGKIYKKLDMPDLAGTAFRIASEEYSDIASEAALSLIELTMIRTSEGLSVERNESKRSTMIEEGMARLTSIAVDQDPAIRARAEIERARLLFMTGKDSASLLRAINLLDSVIESYPSERGLAAEAMILKADVYARIGMSDAVYPAYMSVITMYPDVSDWANEAADRILKLTLADIEKETIEEKIKYLRDFADNHRKENPLLSIAALNRVGDLFFSSGEWPQAKAAYYGILDQFRMLNRQTSAARLSLAEILYREERYRQALDLYETEIALRPYEDNISNLARAGYIRKSVASGEYLIRLGEIPSARKIFKELIEYDDAIVEAHRGYIKCAAALNSVPSTLTKYQARLKKDPSDPIAMYSTALCLTYLNDKQSLEEAQRLLLGAINVDGRIEYFHQTLGYVFEVLETVYEENGMLEQALESYKKAYFLNDHENNPENAANLVLNLGNTYYVLGQYRRAFLFYSQRLEANRPFDDDNTEILFYRRLGAAAFQAGKPKKTITAFTKALDLIDSRMAPAQASDAFDSISRYIMDRIVAPGMRQPDISEKLKDIAKTQSGINRRLSKLNQRDILPPPAPGWKTYRAGIEELLSDQVKLNHQLIYLLEKHRETGLQADEIGEILSNKLRKVDEALRFPERLVQLRAEVLDRLGLAYQESGLPEKAMTTFEKAYGLNKDLVGQGLGVKENLPRNRRSVAYNAYLFAETLSGERRRKLLQETAEDFVRVIDLVETFGVPAKKKEKGKGLVSITAQVSLDEIGSTQAGYGFTAEQEIRLAEAFLTRIHLELGELETAEKAIQKQLAEYPVNKPVSDRDVYGVSLLYHRAGQLAAARGNLTGAFEYFRYSADLSLRMQNPVSTAVNVTNMASLLAMMPSRTPELTRFGHQLEVLDTKTTRLLAKDPFVAGKPVGPIYHNKMGVYFTNFPDWPDSRLEAAVFRLRTRQRAALHFHRGLKILEQEEHFRSREKLALLAALHLNMAHVEEGQGAAAHFESAFTYSRRGILPELMWRALAGLGRLHEALDVLETVTLLRAGCGPGEITTAFSKLVVNLVEEDNPEAAFNLAEHLSELERFNRLASIVGDLQEKGKDPSSRIIFRKLYTKLERIQTLRQKIIRATGEEKQYLIEQLSRENLLFEEKLAKDDHVLPDALHLLQDSQTRETILLLLGLAAHAEEIADSFAKISDKDRSATLLKTYNNLVEQYQKLRATALSARPEEMSADILTLFGPEPHTAADVMKHLCENCKLVRLVATDRKVPATIVFKITPHSISASQQALIDDSLKSLIPLDEGFVYVGYENINRVFKDMPEDMHLSYTLSGTHLVRSIKNRKPFKQTLLAVPGIDKDITGYDIKVLKGLSDHEISTSTEGVNILFVSDSISLTTSVPTQAAKHAKPFLAVKSSDPAGVDQVKSAHQVSERQKNASWATRGYRVPVQRLLVNSANLSLALLPGAAIRDAYFIGHIFSIFGCSGVILPDRLAGGSDFIGHFLQIFPSTSAQEALEKARSLSRGNEHWLQLGFRGMTPEESQAFSMDYFARYIQQGQQAFESNHPARALLMFENAIQIARTVDEFRQYLPPLYNFGRDSAAMAGKQKKAVEYGDAVVNLMAVEDPGSEQHAKALLMLGSVHAQFEQYEKAVPHIEKAVTIMTDLKLAPDQIEALAGLGIVLANATEYDRALVHLQSAVSLSKALDQKELLARHYTSIGGIYDRGLNQYALAIKNYHKALTNHREAGRTADIARMLLSIGRCYRLMGNFIEAESLYQQALELVDGDAENIRLKVQIMFEQANSAWFQARYEEAFRLQRTCYKLSRQHGWPLMQTLSLNTSGLIWWTLGDNQKALEELEKALFDGRNLKVPDDEIANVIHNIGLVYREMGRYKDALDAFDQALAIDTRLKSRWAIAYDLRNKALTFLRMGQPDSAVPLFEQASTHAKSIGNRVNEAKALLGLAGAHFASGNHPKAERNYNDALSLSRSMALRETEWRSLYGLAKLRLAEKKREEAAVLLFDAVKIIESVRADIKIDRLKESFIDNKLSVYETLVGLLADMGKVVESFELAERSRARNFVDLLGNQRLSLSGTIAQELYDRQILIKSKIEEHEALLAQSGEEADRTMYREALAKLNSDYDDLMLDIQSENPQLSAMITVEPLKADKLLQILEKDVALLAYYVLPNEIFCWVIRPQGIKLTRTPIGRDTFGLKILEFRRMIQNLEPLEEQSRELYNWLLTPVISDLNDVKALGIIPHGPLHYLSFATLSDESSYIIDRYSLFYLPNASVLGYTLSKRTRAKKLSVLAIGNPDLGDPVFELPFAEHEISSIKWNFPSITLLTKDKATESWVVKNIEKFDIIHMASHGEFNPVNPLFSAIKLSKGEDTDGDLEATEIFGLRINADVVVLSACQTGLGKVTSGDDVIGLNRAFFYAGTHTIVSSLWRVSDTSTAVLIKQFYRQYVGNNKADSLRLAILHVKNRHPHPSHWGAFTLVGDYY